MLWGLIRGKRRDMSEEKENYLVIYEADMSEGFFDIASDPMTKEEAIEQFEKVNNAIFICRIERRGVDKLWEDVGNGLLEMNASQRKLQEKFLDEIQYRLDVNNEALEKIGNWCKAYPVEVFPKLTDEDWRQARKALESVGLSLDRISADNMRHVLEGIKKYCKTGLEGGVIG